MTKRAHVPKPRPNPAHGHGRKPRPSAPLYRGAGARIDKGRQKSDNPAHGILTVAVDSREPWPHVWERHLPHGWSMVRATLETGDVAVAGLPHGVLIERKTVTDFLACVGRERDRFERELKRGRYAARMVVIVEGGLPDVLAAARGLSHESIVGTVAAWSVRYCPFLFAGSVNLAAELCWRTLAAQVRDIRRQHEAMTVSDVSL